MTFRKPTSRWALWVFAAALVLRAAMPLLASASAEAQGKTMVEVCSVYGVSMVPLDGADRHDHAPESRSAHSGEHCALSALAAMSAPSMVGFTDLPIARSKTGPPIATRSLRVHDASATWIARLKHGPPALA